MANDTETTQATDPPGTDDQRLDRLEDTQREQGVILERIEAALSRLVPGSHAEAQQRTEEHLDRGSSIKEQVEAELARRDKEAADRQAADAERADRETIREAAARLREKPPAPPRNPVKALATKGWGDG